MKKVNWSKLFGLIIILAFAVVLFFAFKTNGTPRQARDRRLDQERSMRLSNLAYSVNDLFNNQSGLPTNLDGLNSNYNFNSPDNRLDPNTQKQFEYKVVDKNKFELCANFMTDTVSNKPSLPLYSQPYPATPASFTPPDFNVHKTGRFCFNITVQKNIPPNVEPKIK